ncbi:uncharacterized protein B0I36DRAFT_382261 [Microdochium trichocladiopsis]|uniref:Uncharacterized protein n=1 Tax=Microdochium trichocladiopsis TaxID=1682393 RepID=A0A9P8YEK4_9PEZI|nr:uncharacterized protein B0I36DRAFT_382261 [Microdochium trichocladiopsis]KAH7035583.1 hypothetical protein B0I36DRAFT_382261 [Microdochium trichocladiopsis]
MLRPSSSDGLRSESDTIDSFRVDKKRLDKRISRDDSWIVTGKAGARTRQYIPPRGLPTPEASPTSNYVEPLIVPTPWAPTPREEQIGMALGSPSLVPPWNTSASRNPAGTGSPAIVSPFTGAVDGPSPGGPTPRKGSGKWKIFGMFGRKAADTSAQGTSPVPSQSDFGTPRTRTDLYEPSTPGDIRSKPPISRSQTMPSPREFGKETKRRPSMSRMRKPKTNDLAPPMPSPYGNSNNNSSSSVITPAVGQSGFLDVNIPSIEMERYSIMFEKVLNPQRVSLLSRRQGALEQLKTAGEVKNNFKKQTISQPIRRATSPSTTSHARSPSFTLFPQSTTPRRTGPTGSQMLSPEMARARSNTSPAHLPSPTKTTFDQPPSELKGAGTEGAPTLTYNHLRDTPQNGKLTIASLARARGDHRHPPRTSYFVGEPSPIMESPMEMETPTGQAGSKSGGQVPKPSAYELSRQMAAAQAQTTPTAAIKAHAASASTASLTSASASSAGGHAANSSISSAQTYRTLNSQISLYTDTDVDETDPMVIGGGREMTPAEVSIARQISLSRQQRKKFQPTLTVASTQNKVGRTSSKPRIQTDQIESARMVTPKTATPTLVVPEDPLHSPYATPLGVARSRKSERIIIDAT